MMKKYILPAIALLALASPVFAAQKKKDGGQYANRGVAITDSRRTGLGLEYTSFDVEAGDLTTWSTGVMYASEFWKTKGGTILTLRLRAMYGQGEFEFGDLSEDVTTMEIGAGLDANYAIGEKTTAFVGPRIGYGQLGYDDGEDINLMKYGVAAGIRYQLENQTSHIEFGISHMWNDADGGDVGTSNSVYGAVYWEF